ncbi:helix-turn-helix domain-containing protein [Taibaiella chishuiensis]|uniref:Helix-turn-helix protein n=1 Tax=Taibaiella chishuiensis TaxID=1434707 RepID=A0A2P8D2U0_9BACT|nr:helix-turn-helix transcriptional regulator [Taibaiella chishuiensis]PSK91548.1 helix-turn-helix protein [Taibaiella chishuiensis]
MLRGQLHTVKTIGAYHRLRQLPEAGHPLISVIDLEQLRPLGLAGNTTFTLDFYWIALRRSSNATARYGQQVYDFNKGILSFMAPKQVFSIACDDKNELPEKSGWALLVHPDFIWNTTLAKTIGQYDFFDYSVNEGLFLSEKEEKTLNGILALIEQECQSGRDRFSKQIIITHLENLLSYANRFYNRQFLTREKSNHQILERLEALLVNYFNSEAIISKGLPTVRFVADALNVSPKYLGSVLRVLTGQNTQQHIHEKLIEKAKEKLSVTNLTVSEIAYELGFEQVQSFSRLFKTRTGFSPVAFRRSFS